MGTKKKFTPEELKHLQANPYTLRVTADSISYTLAFKEAFWALSLQGYSTMMVIKYNNTGSTTTNVRWIKMSWIFFQIPLNYVVYILFEIEKIWGVATGKKEAK